MAWLSQGSQGNLRPVWLLKVCRRRSLVRRSGKGKPRYIRTQDQIYNHRCSYCICVHLSKRVNRTLQDTSGIKGLHQKWSRYSVVAKKLQWVRKSQVSFFLLRINASSHPQGVAFQERVKRFHSLSCKTRWVLYSRKQLYK